MTRKKRKMSDIRAPPEVRDCKRTTLPTAGTLRELGGAKSAREIDSRGVTSCPEPINNPGTDAAGTAGRGTATCTGACMASRSGVPGGLALAPTTGRPWGPTAACMTSARENQAPVSATCGKS